MEGFLFSEVLTAQHFFHLGSFYGQNRSSWNRYKCLSTLLKSRKADGWMLISTVQNASRNLTLMTLKLNLQLFFNRKMKQWLLLGTILVLSINNYFNDILLIGEEEQGRGDKRRPKGTCYQVNQLNFVIEKWVPNSLNNSKFEISVSDPNFLRNITPGWTLLEPRSPQLGSNLWF